MNEMQTNETQTGETLAATIPADAGAPFTQASILAGVRSYMPGRLRLRLEVLKALDETMLATVRQTLADRPGVIEAVINPRVGSVLLTWDPLVTDLDLTALAREAADLLEAGRAMGLIGHGASDAPGAESGACSRCAPGLPLQKAAEALKAPADQALELLAKLIAPDVSKGARGKRVAQNRLMLALLALSMGALTVSSNKAHYVLGTGFLGLLAAHLWQHRKVL